MKLSVVIPARNEARVIAGTVVGITDHLDSVGITDTEIVVVDDGSTDDTSAVVAEISNRDPRVRLVTNSGANGYGRAVRLGLSHFTGDAVVVAMGDASDAPADVAAYYKILRDEAECAFGSRFIKGSAVTGYPRVKLMINRLVNTGIRIMFGLRCNDMTNAFKGYRRNVIEGCSPLVSPHFNLTIEIPLKAVARGFTYRTVPISWCNRSVGTSNLLLKEQGSRYLFTLLTVWFEWLLVRGDYRRQDKVEAAPWGRDATDASESEG